MFNESAFVKAKAEARQIRDQTKFPPAVDDSQLEATDILSWTWLDEEGAASLDALIEMQHATDYDARAVVGATLYALTSIPANETNVTLKEAFGRFLESVVVADLADPVLLRWELHVAAAARSLERVLEIGRRFETLSQAAELRASLVKTIFLLVHPSVRNVPQLIEPSAFDPLINAHAPEAKEHIAEYCDFMTREIACTVEKEDVFQWIVERQYELQWQEPEDFAGSVLEALIDIDTLLRRIKNATKSLTPTQHAIQSWVWFAEGAAAHDLGRLNQAGRNYETLPAHPYEEGPQIIEWLPATRCFARAGNWSAVKEAARKWIAEVPEDADARLRLAEAHHKLSELPEAIHAYEDYVRLSKTSANDWRSTLLLQLGLEVNTRRNAAATLETAAFSARFRPQGEGLIAWSYPWFDSLSRKAKERWWEGMFSLSSPHVITEIGDQRWDRAANCFGAAVEFQLKESVFQPFAGSSRIVPTDPYWTRVLTGRGMLGDLINCLLQTRHPNNQTAKQLSDWLKTHHPRLQDHIRDSRERLRTISALRGQAQHGSVTEAETRELFVEAADLLRAIAEMR